MTGSELAAAQALAASTYPAPPWRLHGRALLVPGSVPAYVSLPPDLAPLPARRGRALAGLLLASYRDGSTLRYEELIAGVIARRGARVGLWISHIYVNDERSVAGGREIWGLPKRLADFGLDAGWTVQRDGQALVRARHAAPRARVLLPTLAPYYGTRGESRLYAVGRGLMWLGAVRCHVELGRELAELGLEPARIGLAGSVAISMPAAAPLAQG